MGVLGSESLTERSRKLWRECEPMERDTIDSMLEGLARELPALDTRGLSVGSRILVLGKLVEKRLDDCLSPLGIQLWGFEVLASLRRAGAPFMQTPTELMSTCFLTSGAVTNRVNRLEKIGLVERRSDPDDRRSVKVRLTKQGMELVERAYLERVENMQTVFSVLSDTERESLACLLRKLVLSFGMSAPNT